VVADGTTAILIILAMTFGLIALGGITAVIPSSIKGVES
jgi:hypothetical protein